MKILQVSTRMILGGSQETVVLAAEELTRRGHEVHIAHGPIFGPEGSLAQRIDDFRTPDGRGIVRHVIPSMVRELNPFKDIRAYRQLRALIRALKPDIVHTHSSKAGIVGRAAAWAHVHAGARPGVLHSVHGSPFHEHERRLKNTIYIASERFAARRCHAILTVSDSLRERYLRAGIGKPAQYHTVISGMDMREYDEPPGAHDTREATRTALGIEQGDIVVGTVARLFELKGHDDLLDALADELRAEPRLRLLWVGDGAWRDRLTRRIASMGLETSVIFTGLVPPARIPALIRAMDILAHPSLREGLPRVVVQAILLGVPVVATDIEGTGEVCMDQTTGRLVPAADPAALGRAIMWMTHHPEQAARLAGEARRFVRTRFDARAMTDDLERMYASFARGVDR